MFQASLSTRHYEFTAFGQTKDEATQALETGLLEHAKACELEPDWFDEYREDFNFLEFELGACFRDFTQINGSHENSAGHRPR